jgi:hypothetical protein
MVALYVAARPLSGPGDWRRIRGDRLQGRRTSRTDYHGRHLRDGRSVGRDAHDS